MRQFAACVGTAMEVLQALRKVRTSGVSGTQLHAVRLVDMRARPCREMQTSFFWVVFMLFASKV
jgi:hypothetical protein